MNTKIAIKQFEAIKKLKGDMRLAAEGWDSKFQVLISTILSARSLDETTIKYCNILFSKYHDAKSLSNANLKDIENIIRPINFYKNKSKYIIECSKQLYQDYNGTPPMDFEKLVKLKGVGSKTANVFLSEYGHDTIGIDTHVAYISYYLEWTKSKNPDKIEEDLKKIAGLGKGIFDKDAVTFQKELREER